MLSPWRSIGAASKVMFGQPDTVGATASECQEYGIGYGLAMLRHVSVIISPSTKYDVRAVDFAAATIFVPPYSEKRLSHIDICIWAACVVVSDLSDVLRYR